MLLNKSNKKFVIRISNSIRSLEINSFIHIKDVPSLKAYNIVNAELEIRPISAL